MEQRRYEFRTTPEQGDAIDAAAERKGLPVATWIRMVTLEAARRELGEPKGTDT